MSDKITKSTPAEDLLKTSPKVLDYLVRRGVCGIRLKFPVSGTIEEMAKEKNFSEFEIEKTLSGLNDLLNQPE